MSLIDKTYFTKRLLAIPNLARPEIENKLNDYIEKYEPVYLTKMLGLELYDEFLAGLEEDPIPQKWVDLRDGKTFTSGGVTYNWSGFQNADKSSPIGNYVFSKFFQDNQSFYTGIGDVKPVGENSTPQAYRTTISKVWNEMVYLDNNLWMFLNEYPNDYPNWLFNDYIMLEKDNVLGI